jgi:hypothetical protein
LLIPPNQQPLSDKHSFSDLSEQEAKNPFSNKPDYSHIFSEFPVQAPAMVYDTSSLFSVSFS